MRGFNKIIDEYMVYDVDCDMHSRDVLINVYSQSNDDIAIKKVGIYERFLNIFRACFV
jgi:hypothetical protein